jgi:hypothetical protein
LPAVGELLIAAEKVGQVRSGLDPADILLLMGFLWRVGPASPVLTKPNASSTSSSTSAARRLES